MRVLKGEKHRGGMSGTLAAKGREMLPAFRALFLIIALVIVRSRHAQAIAGERCMARDRLHV